MVAVYSSPIARFYALAIIVFHFAQWYFVDGVEKLEMLMYGILQEWKGAGTPAAGSPKDNNINPYDKYLKSE